MRKLIDVQKIRRSQWTHLNTLISKSHLIFFSFVKTPLLHIAIWVNYFLSVIILFQKYCSNHITTYTLY